MNDSKRFNQEFVEQELRKIFTDKLIEKSSNSLKLMFSLIDLTSLSTDDTVGKIKNICLKVNGFSEKFPDVPDVGAICVYPSLVHVVKNNLNVRGVGIASVAAGFPSSQTFLTVKEQECKLAVEAGATEIDIVISVGKYLENDLDFMEEEISRIKKASMPAKLKVILETGLLPGPEYIYGASMASLRSGADFIKTSTGKVQPAATHGAVFVMCQAIKDHYDKSGYMAGIKPAGGISTADEAIEYASIVKTVLGEEWLSPGLFRIGASRLANQILSEISFMETGNPDPVNYF